MLNVKCLFEANLYIRISHKSGGKFLLSWMNIIPYLCRTSAWLSYFSPSVLHPVYHPIGYFVYRKPNSISVLFQNFEPWLQKLNSVFLTLNVNIWFQQSLKDLVTYAQLQLSHLLKLRMKTLSIIYIIIYMWLAVKWELLTDNVRGQCLLLP